MNKSHASSIALWSRVLVGCVAAAIALTAVRVGQLKAAPTEQLVRSMQRPNGQLIQQRAAEEPEPRGRIVDRVGRLLALDTVGGRLFIDVKDLYTDALERSERAEIEVGDLVRLTRMAVWPGETTGKGIPFATWVECGARPTRVRVSEPAADAPLAFPAQSGQDSQPGGFAGIFRPGRLDGRHPPFAEAGAVTPPEDRRRS